MKNGGKNSKPVALEFLVLNTYVLDFDWQTVSLLTLGSRIIFFLCHVLSSENGATLIMWFEVFFHHSSVFQLAVSVLFLKQEVW